MVTIEATDPADDGGDPLADEEEGSEASIAPTPRRMTWRRKRRQQPSCRSPGGAVGAAGAGAGPLLQMLGAGAGAGRGESRYL